MENTGKHSFLPSVCVTGGPGEKRENGIKAIFEKIMTKISPKLTKGIELQI